MVRIVGVPAWTKLVVVTGALKPATGLNSTGYSPWGKAVMMSPLLCQAASQTSFHWPPASAGSVKTHRLASLSGTGDGNRTARTEFVVDG